MGSVTGSGPRGMEILGSMAGKLLRNGTGFGAIETAVVGFRLAKLTRDMVTWALCRSLLPYPSVWANAGAARPRASE